MGMMLHLGLGDTNGVTTSPLPLPTPEELAAATAKGNYVPTFNDGIKLTMTDLGNTVQGKSMGIYPLLNAFAPDTSGQTPISYRAGILVPYVAIVAAIFMLAKK